MRCLRGWVPATVACAGFRRRSLRAGPIVRLPATVWARFSQHAWAKLRPILSSRERLASGRCRLVARADAHAATFAAPDGAFASAGRPLAERSLAARGI